MNRPTAASLQNPQQQRILSVCLSDRVAITTRDGGILILALIKPRPKGPSYPVRSTKRLANLRITYHCVCAFPSALYQMFWCLRTPVPRAAVARPDGPPLAMAA
jgi:hypothetical protein